MPTIIKKGCVFVYFPRVLEHRQPQKCVEAYYSDRLLVVRPTQFVGSGSAGVSPAPTFVGPSHLRPARAKAGFRIARRAGRPHSPTRHFDWGEALVDEHERLCGGGKALSLDWWGVFLF